VHKPFDVRELDRLVAKDIATPGESGGRPEDRAVGY
jgi:hypothetical protein